MPAKHTLLRFDTILAVRRVHTAIVHFHTFLYRLLFLARGKTALLTLGMASASGAFLQLAQLHLDRSRLVAEQLSTLCHVGAAGDGEGEEEAEDEVADRRHGTPWTIAKDHRRERTPEETLAYYEGLPERLWVRLFRISKAMYDQLKVRLSQREEFQRSRTLVGIQICVAIQRLSQSSTVPRLVIEFGVSAGSVVAISVRVWKAIPAEFWQSKVAALKPDTEEKRVAEATGMAQRVKSGSTMACCIGAIDCTHHPIPKPSLACMSRGEADSYVNITDGPCIRAQLICNHKKQFYSVRYGATGTTSDATALQRSTFHAERHNLMPEPYWIAADGGYPLTALFQTPFNNRADCDAIQLAFNQRFSGIRVVIEQAFGLFKARWRVFTSSFMLENLERYNYAFSTAVVLHNWCIEEAVEVDAELASEALRLAAEERRAKAERAVRGAIAGAAAAPQVGAQARDTLAAGKVRRAQLMREAGLISTAAQLQYYSVLD